MRRPFVELLVLVAAMNACGGTQASNGNDGGSDAGRTICGDAGCTSAQVCVIPPCDVNVNRQCIGIPAEGCPASWDQVASCPDGGAGAAPAGCMAPACLQPPRFCADLPAECSGTPACGCLHSLCGAGNSCGSLSGRYVGCTMD